MVSLTPTKGTGQDRGRPSQRGRDGEILGDRASELLGAPPEAGARESHSRSPPVPNAQRSASEAEDGSVPAASAIDFTATLLSFLPVPDMGGSGTVGEDGPDGRSASAAAPVPGEAISPALLAATLAVADAWRDYLLPLIDLLDAVATMPIWAEAVDGEEAVDAKESWADAPAGRGSDRVPDLGAGDGMDDEAEVPPEAVDPVAVRIGALVDQLRATYDVEGELVETIGTRPRLGAFRLHIRQRAFVAEIANTGHLYDGMVKATIAEALAPAQPISIAQALRIADRERRAP